MYLHYYFGKRHCGQMDSDLVFNFPKSRPFIVIAHDEKHMDMLSAFQLVHGKALKVLTPQQAAKQYGNNTAPAEIFTTKKMGDKLELPCT